MTNRYISSLDTLRFFSIIAIIFYHYFEHLFPGGFLGVDVFFILSGFLITLQLERHYLNKTNTSTVQQIKKRFLKIFKPMFVFIVISLVFLFLFNGQLLTNVRGSIGSSLLMVNNWFQIFSGQSYFGTYISPSIYTHLWYLSVYFQMNLICYILYKPLRRFFDGKETQLLYLVIGLALASGLLMGVLYTPGKDPSRVYYGTDTRMFSFLFGMAAALLSSLPKLEKVKEKLPRLLIDFGIIICLIIMGFFILNLTSQETFTYRGGIFLFDLTTTLCVLLVTSRLGTVSKFFTFKPFVWIGKQSLSIYLWYYPIYIIGYVNASSDNFFANHALLQIIFILLLGIIYERFFVSKDLTVEIISKSPSTNPHVKRLKQLNWSKISAVLLTLFSLYIVIQAPSSQEANALEEESKKAQELIAERNELISQSQEKAQKTVPFEDYLDQISDEQDIFYKHFNHETAKWAYQTPLTFIGDSIVVGASKAIYTLYPNATVGANIGQQLSQSISIIEDLKTKDQLADDVVVFLGSNGAFTQDQLNKLTESLNDRNLYLVSSHVSRPWVDSVNQMFNQADSNDQTDSIHFVDWASYFHGSPDTSGWLAPDGIHLSEEGMSQWLSFISDSVKEINEN